MIIKHGSYIAEVTFDPEAEMMVGSVINLSTPITFMAKDAPGLMKEFKTSADEYIQICKERGLKPEKAYSGKFVLRTGIELHSKAALAAAQSGKSLNTWLIDTIEEKVG